MLKGKGVILLSSKPVIPLLRFDEDRERISFALIEHQQAMFGDHWKKASPHEKMTSLSIVRILTLGNFCNRRVTHPDIIAYVRLPVEGNCSGLRNNQSALCLL